MQQRLGVACAVLGGPALLVLDEPTNGLDPAGVVEMRRLITDLAADGHTVLLSSHQLAEVQQICDSVAVISDGRVVHDGTVASMRGAATLRLRVAPADGGRDVVTRLAGHPVEASPAASGAAVLSVPATDVDVPTVVRELVAAGIAVHEVTRAERSLEDVFLTMTGERR
jgi:ABC-2 type transport system ATP-binding protein